MKYRKKPVIIEAEQFRKGFFKGKASLEFKNAICRCGNVDLPRPHIHTLEGTHYVIVGDFIIKGIKGEFYPCKPDIFKATYELVSDKEA